MALKKLAWLILATLLIFASVAISTACGAPITTLTQTDNVTVTSTVTITETKTETITPIYSFDDGLERAERLADRVEIDFRNPENFDDRRLAILYRGEPLFIELVEKLKACRLDRTVHKQIIEVENGVTKTLSVTIPSAFYPYVIFYQGDIPIEFFNIEMWDEEVWYQNEQLICRASSQGVDFTDWWTSVYASSLRLYDIQSDDYPGKSDSVIATVGQEFIIRLRAKHDQLYELASYDGSVLNLVDYYSRYYTFALNFRPDDYHYYFYFRTEQVGDTELEFELQDGSNKETYRVEIVE